MNLTPEQREWLKSRFELKARKLQRWREKKRAEAIKELLGRLSHDLRRGAGKARMYRDAKLRDLRSWAKQK